MKPIAPRWGEQGDARVYDRKRAALNYGGYELLR
jgi:hypothetical protein